MFIEIFQIFLLCLAVFISLILLGKLIQMGKVLVSLDLSLVDLGYLIIYLTPFFLFVLIPVCSMLALFLTFQRMSTDQELIALRSGGISLKNILPSPLMFLLGISAINFFISFYGISWGMDNFNSYLIDLAKKKARLSLKPGIFNREIRGFTIYPQRVDEEKGEIKNIFIEQKNVSGKNLIIISPKGYLKWDPENKILYFSIFNGKIYQGIKMQPTVLSFSRYDLKLDLKKVLKNIHIDSNDPKFMSFKNIKKHIQHISHNNKNYIELVEEMHKRIAIPLSCLILGFFSIPLGWLLEGMKKFYGSVIILFMFFVYYLLFALGKSLVEGGVLHPALGIWTPNVVFLFLTLFVFYIAEKEKIKLSTRD